MKWILPSTVVSNSNGFGIVDGMEFNVGKVGSLNAGHVVAGSMDAGTARISTLQVSGSATINNFSLGVKETTFNGGTIHNANIDTATVALLNVQAGTTLTGVVAGPNGAPRLLVNVGTNNVTLKNDDAGSAVGNRLLVGSSGGFVLGPNQSRWMVYAVRVLHWILV